MAGRSAAKGKKAAEGRLLPPKKGATVRMYNTGFGDCFLLAFPADNGEAFYVLIDCGVHHIYDKGDERIRLVAKDIARATGNRIDVVAITHEHSDHLYGFMHAEDIFEKMEIKDLWLAWTEDPTDPLARKLKDIYKAKFSALQAAIARLEAAGSPMAESLKSIMTFDLPPDGIPALRGNKNILDALRGWSHKKLERSEDFRTPEEKPIDLPGVSGVRCYVLGPPKDEKAIGKEWDKYEAFLRLDEEMAFMAAVEARLHDAEGDDVNVKSDVEEEGLMALLYPFDKTLSIPEDKAYNNEDYGDYFSRYRGEDGWQRIDSDWLGAADQLALSINRKTNNTSLVLAFELMQTDPAKVLLFTGDAQIGSWLTWRGIEWQVDEGQGKLTGEDLIKKTVLFKVGHHGSINATAKKNGLDLMKSKELVAMIPVDQRWANKIGWNHPADKVLKGVMEKARGRVIRSDMIPMDGLQIPPELTESEWNEFQKNLEWDRSTERLWIQYTVQ